MTSLSPAAQAVMDATDYPEDLATRIRVGAALQAAAAQEKLGPDHWEGSWSNDYEQGWNAALRKISRIAVELERL
jgi:hypothetical protein